MSRLSRRGFLGHVAGAAAAASLPQALFSQTSQPAKRKPKDGNKTALLLYLIVMVPITHGTADASVSAGVITTLTAVIPASLLLPFILMRRKIEPEPMP